MFQSREPLSRREAWIWLISAAVWKARAVFVDGKRVELGRGQLAHSVRFLADQWHWPKSNVSRFLEALKTETMIETQSGTGITIITVCKYDEYQRVSLPDRDSNQDASRDINGTRAGHERDKEEDRKDKEKDSFSALASDWPPDAWDQFWARYPHKVGKHDAELKFGRARKTGVAWSTLISGLDRYIREKPIDRAWCNPSTWLHQQRWADQPAGDENGQSPHQVRTSAATGRQSTGQDAILTGMGNLAAKVALRIEAEERERDLADGCDAAGRSGPRLI
jgi:hypothetical protein